MDDLAHWHIWTISDMEQKENKAYRRATFNWGKPFMLAAQSELFDRPGPAGLAQGKAIVAPSEERTLIGCIDELELSPFRFQGWLGKRLTASFGWRYDLDTGHFGPTNPIPEWLLPLRQKAARFAGLAPDELAQALVI